MKSFSSFLNRRSVLGLFGAITLAGTVQTVPAADKPTIPIIVKDTTSFFWQIVFAGARKAGQDLGINVVELGPDVIPIPKVRSGCSRAPSRQIRQRWSLRLRRLGRLETHR